MVQPRFRFHAASNDPAINKLFATHDLSQTQKNVSEFQTVTKAATVKSWICDKARYLHYSFIY